MENSWRLAEGLRRVYSSDMIYQFGTFELDLAALELRAGGETRALEPQVFRLLALLVENRTRLVGREEIIEKVWEGRPVSDAAIASRVKSARCALGDDGRSQRYIRTLHRRGFRFIGDVRVSPSATDCAGGAAAPRSERGSRPSLAVLPFRMTGGPSRYEALASALPDELITELSRLRWLLVTARGSSFRVQAARFGLRDVGRLLGVRYCLSGSLEIAGRSLTISVELADTLDEGIVWADRLCGRLDDVHSMRDQIRSRILMALDIRIPLHEARLARLLLPEDLDAWSAYHLGLQHVYRFNRADNAAAARLFGRAVALDPCFARAYAGLSFVHFQTAFMHYATDVPAGISKSRCCAERGLELDPLDPFVNFTMGRSYWLEGDLDSSLGWLERATSLSPHYAQGIYARAWTEALAGRTREGRSHADLAMRLSPIDPLHYAMMGTRAFTHMLVDEDAEAAAWAERSARAPGAHVLIAMIAAAAHHLNGDHERAARWAANVRERNGSLRTGDFLRAFPIRPEGARARISRALTTLGF
ncbi:MAG TPA: winged helix-turn-helix domain-containing protein [Steroidobacteraceae bacterium]|nr:winged helix-turn-helix domain-containing protein [Steroidobacteraceae bacterium]